MKSFYKITSKSSGISFYYKSKLAVKTTTHSWCDDHSTSVNACGGVEGKNWDSSFQEGTPHIYTLRLD